MDNEKSYKVRDLRKKSQFIIDDEYLNGYAKLVSPYATLAYLSLCRHADKKQVAFPSYAKIAEEFRISSESARKGIDELVALNIINKRRMGRRLCNEYTLIDKSEWVSRDSVQPYKNNRKISKNESDTNDVGITSKIGDTNDTLFSDTNDVGAKDAHKKDAHTTEFEKFWNSYPRHINRKSALKVFLRISPSAELFSKMMASLEVQKKSKQWLENDGRFIPHPGTWLNGERWEDDVLSGKSEKAERLEKFGIL
jgi:hypothetical protein